MLHAQLLQQSGQALFDVALGQGLALLIALQFQHGADVFLYREFAKNRRFLRQIRQPQARAAVDWHVRHRLAVNEDVAAVAGYQADDHVERGSFTRTVGAEQTDDLAFLHHQRDVLDDLAAAVGLLQVLHLQAAVRRRNRRRHIGHSGGRGRTRHGLSLPSLSLGRSAGPGAPGTGGVPAGASLGASTARTREPGVAGALAAVLGPSTVKTSVRL